MKMIVLIKQVPETGNVRMDPETGTMIREGVETIVNPLDLYAIETGIRLRESWGGTLTALTMGPPNSDKALREAVAMGCDDAVQLTDRAFAGSDTWATARVLAETIRQKLAGFDLVLCGERATDGETGQVGPGVGSFLDLPVVTYVSAVEKWPDGEGLRVRRLVEGGYEVLRVPFPALVSVVKEISFPRLPTLAGKRKSRKMEIPLFGVQDLKLDRDKTGLNGSPTRVVRIFTPRVAREGRKRTVRDERDLKDVVNELLDYLDEKNLLPCEGLREGRVKS